MPSKVIISCAVTGSIHTPSMSDYLPITPEQIAARRDRGGGGGRGDHPPARPRSGNRRTDARPERVHALPAGDQAERRCRGEHHHRRRPDDDAGRAARRAAGGEAGDVQPQHGQHELQHRPGRRPGEGLETRLGEAVSRRHRQFHLPQHVPRHRRHRRAAGQDARHALRVSSATTPGTCTTWPIAWTRRSSSRRCSCRRSSASWAASAPIRAT